MAMCPFLSGWVFNGTDAEFKQEPCKTTQCQLWDEVNNRCGLMTSDYNKAIVDLMNENKPTKAMKLTQEFMTKQDLDGDGRIYGFDFKFSNPPPGLKSLENHPDFNHFAPEEEYETNK